MLMEAPPAPRTAPRVRDPWLAGLDLVACAVLAVLGSVIARGLDPTAAGDPVRRALIAAPLALVGLLGVGMERARWGPVTGLATLLATLGASAGAVAGAFVVEPERAITAWALVVRALVPAVGIALVPLGARFKRTDEPWRAHARLGPPEATPPLALAIAALRLPVVVRALLVPVILAAAPVGVLGLVAIRCYQVTFSRLMPDQCRFEPSCSHYGMEAFWRHGPFKGFLLTGLRLVRCQPFSAAGHDPVPEVRG